MDAEQPKEAVRLGKVVFQIGYIVNLTQRMRFTTI